MRGSAALARWRWRGPSPVLLAQHQWASKTAEENPQGAGNGSLHRLSLGAGAGAPEAVPAVVAATHDRQVGHLAAHFFPPPAVAGVRPLRVLLRSFASPMSVG